MYSLATRSALKRSVAPVSRVSVFVPRYSSTMHDNDPEVLELEKQRNLRNEQHKTSSPIRNAPGWNQYLATASEAAVKADRDDLNPSELQERTVQYVKQRHSVESPNSNPERVPPTHKKTYETEERIDAAEATYERDEVGGPLKDSGTKETDTTETYEETVKTDKRESGLAGGT
ncbi:unnamed protein product [Somion occarium]|uniref:Uncharacterized protein n=1 Tax=Somion occarium TaxID=3059160 RepID=A0ABP1ECK8_9APHY